jgi:diguanylate cyclase (GGDEF)-like protein/PAS domain S-box-containing protein
LSESLQKSITAYVENGLSERLSRIVDTQRAIAAAGLDLQSVMDLVCERMQELTGAQGAAVLLLEDGALVRRANNGSLAGPSVVGVPLHRGDAIAGELQAYSHCPDAFTADDRSTLELLSLVLSAAVSRAYEIEALTMSATIFHKAPIGIVRVEAPDGRLVEVNPAFEEMLGYSADELAAMSFREYTHPDDVDENMQLFHSLMRGERDSYQLDKRSFRRDGTMLWTQVNTALERDAEGRPQFAVSMMQDITERRRAEEELRRQAEINEHQALHDALTGLPNRTLFRDRITQAILAAQREGEVVAVMMLDLDRFKEVNDSLGHDAGDVLLQEVAQRLEGALRASDTIARLGGDEFGILLPRQCRPADVRVVIDRICETLSQPVVLEDLPLAIEGSLGVAMYPEHGTTVDALLQRADMAMYTAKEGSGPFAFFDESAERYDPSRLTLVGELRRAIERQELVLHYQPKATVASGEVAAVEALLRWQHPERGLVLPNDFIPVAQQTSLIRPLTQYVIDAALQQCRTWLDEGLQLSIAVNVSIRNLLDMEFPQQVSQLLGKWNVAPRFLELEITESTMLTDPVRTTRVLERLSAMGIRLSIDDFGTGYSSLSYLSRLPVDEIKIDRSFVTNMTHNQGDAIIVRSTIDLGRNLGLEVVAEGVETAECWEELTSLGCTAAQGYYLSRPLPAAELSAWLREHVAA